MRVHHLHAWLLALSDPTGCRTLPERPLPAACWAQLCSRADGHGVLPAVLANAKRALATEGVPRLATGADAGAVLEKALTRARDSLIVHTALCLAIRGQIREIAAAFQAAGVPVAVLKGADFADHLYPDPSLRPFTDLDILVPRTAVGEAEAALSRLGYCCREPSMKYVEGYGEQSWSRSERHEGMVELHWNLVNSPTIRHGVTLSWEDLAFEAEPGADGIRRPTVPARLLIAAVHAAASHGFDRLQPLYDVCLAARRCTGAAEIHWLSDTVQRTGAKRALATALALCDRLFAEPVCEELRRALCLPAHGAWTVLLTPGVVLRGHARRDSFKRQLFRELLKR